AWRWVMMMSASSPPVVFTRSSTAPPIEPMSPLPVVPLTTPQSMRMCSCLAPCGIERRKQSPKPTRYIRTRMPASSPWVPAFLVVMISEPSVDEAEVDAQRVLPRRRRVEEAHLLGVGELPLLPCLAVLAVPALRDDEAHERPPPVVAAAGVRQDERVPGAEGERPPGPGGDLDR